MAKRTGPTRPARGRSNSRASSRKIARGGAPKVAARRTTRKAATGKPPRSKSAVATRVAKHRAQMRRAGMKLLQIWVPDVSRPDFLAEARRQSLLLRDDPQEQEILNWLEQAAAAIDGWKA